MFKLSRKCRWDQVGPWSSNRLSCFILHVYFFIQGVLLLYPETHSSNKPRYLLVSNSNQNHNIFIHFCIG